MSGVQPVAAYAAPEPGLVLLLLDTAAAVAVADAVDFTIASGCLTTTGRRLAPGDVEKIRDAAAQAAADDSHADPAPLRLVTGGGS